LLDMVRTGKNGPFLKRMQMVSDIFQWFFSYFIFWPKLFLDHVDVWYEFLCFRTFHTCTFINFVCCPDWKLKYLPRTILNNQVACLLVNSLKTYYNSFHFRCWKVYREIPSTSDNQRRFWSRNTRDDTR
jgi:hypothetical protein